jgi:hypothetical protein
MEVYTVDADSPEAAADLAKSNSSNSDAVFLAADSLGGLLNPVHWADAQASFGHVQPVSAEEAALTSDDVSE